MRRPKKLNYISDTIKTYFMVRESFKSKTKKDCNNIINNLNKVGINARIIETKSCLDKNVENGCLITCDSEYSDKKKSGQ